MKALSEELENPMNHHRWNQLKGTDPDMFDLLSKVQSLQKRLIKKTEEVVEKDVQNTEKDKRYHQLILIQYSRIAYFTFHFADSDVDMRVVR